MPSVMAGLVPCNPVKIEELSRLNHDPASISYVPSERDEYIIQKAIEGIQKCLSKIKEEVEVKLQNVTPIRVCVKENVRYFADDLLAEDKRRKEEEEMKTKEEVEAKMKAAEDRKRKREEVEKTKEENV